MAMVQIHENDDGDLCFDIESITVLSRMAWAMAYNVKSSCRVETLFGLAPDY